MILHVDMDAFYASVEQREQPELQGKPVVVGGSAKGRGVVSAASYEARKYGIHSAMPSIRARQLCPDAIFVRPRMALYVEVSREIRRIFRHYTPDVEPLSLDEAFLDVSGSEKLFGDAVAIGREIKQRIASELNLIASVGVAPNKFLAKLASDLDKPDGFTVIPADQFQSILDPLPVKRLWGVGKVTQLRLEAVGIRTFSDLRQLGEAECERALGNVGQHFWRLSQGIDHRRVIRQRDARTISHETTFPVDIGDLEVLSAWLLDMTESVAMRVRHSQLSGRTITLKLRYSDFHTITRSATLVHATRSTDQIWSCAEKLLLQNWRARRLDIRLLGLGVSNLESPQARQLDLFDDDGDSANQDERQAAASLDETTDMLRDKFGRGSIRRASTMSHVNRSRAAPPDLQE